MPTEFKPASHWRHIKTGGTYKLIGPAIVRLWEGVDGLRDMDECVVIDDGGRLIVLPPPVGHLSHPILCRARIQTDVILKKDHSVIVYVSDHDQSAWARRESEFAVRFEPVDANG